MTTIKLNKKSSETTNKTRGPVRRADPAKRDRSKAPTPRVKPESANESTRQRNHRHDGSLREAPSANSTSTTEQPILRSEFKDRSFVEDRPAHDNGVGRPTEGKRTDNNGPDNRSKTNEGADKGRVQAETTRNYADREGSYRNPPRRGGKARDGFVASEFDNTRATKTAQHNKAAANLGKQQDSDMPRLSKRMADLGLCSRREADEWIVNGWVKVDDEIIDVLGTRVSPDADIIVSGYAMEHQSESVTILLHKPIGHVSGQAEDGYQPAIVLVHPDNEWLDDPDLNEQNEKEFQRGFLKGLAPAGRLDIDSTGLLVLTQDGRIARHLIGQDTSVEKEYLVRVEGELSDKDLERLNHGLSLDGEQLKPAKVSWQNEDQLRFVLREGKKRQIRRMCEMVGLHVVGLKRVRIGSVNLGKLPLGMWRYLRDNERF
ncbi:MAG: pseudouridine synthase [Methylophilaceae bacterium]